LNSATSLEYPWAPFLLPGICISSKMSWKTFQNEQIRGMDFVSPIIHFALKWTATIAFRMK